MSSVYTPDYWQAVKVTSTEGEVIYKVFATWVGGYINGDSWKLNSGIKKVTIENNHILFSGYSGSVYRCHLNESVYRATAWTQSVLNDLIRKAEQVGAKIEMLPFETNFLELIQNERH
jgi:hypothetical protein